jgi:hypothetical protein
MAAAAPTTTTSPNDLVRRLHNPLTTEVTAPIHTTDPDLNVVIQISKMYLNLLQRPPPVTNTGIFHFWTSLEDHERTAITDVTVTNDSNGNSNQISSSSSSMSQMSSIETVYNAFRICNRINPAIMSAREKQQQQKEKQEKPIRNITSMDIVSKPTLSLSSSVSTGNGNYYQKQHEQQQQQQDQQQSSNAITTATMKENEIKTQRVLIDLERHQNYMDCLSYKTCPELAIRYRNCWQHKARLLQQQQLRHQQQKQSVSHLSNIATPLPHDQQQQAILDRSIQFWRQLKEEGYLNSLCVSEREDVERCIGTNIRNANYERML